MSETAVKRSLGVALRARTWYREFREIVLMCSVYNIKKAANRKFRFLYSIKYDRFNKT